MNALRIALRIAVFAAFFQATATTPDKASVEGIVVEFATGRPIAGAVVELTGIASPEPASSARDWRVRSFSVVTGEGGTFAITGVPAGAAYQLAVTRSPDFIPAVHGQSHPDDPWVPIALAEGQRLANLRIRLRELSSISGTIVDDEGKPARATRVTAIELRYRDGHRVLQDRASTLTDRFGNYRIGGLAPGRYVVRISPVVIVRSVSQGRAAETPSPYIYYPGTMDPADAVGIDVAQMTSVGDINLKNQEMSLRRVGGVVTLAARDRSVAMARVFLIPPQAVPDSTVTREVLASNGEFDFRRVPPGTYTLFAVADIEGASWSGRMPVSVESRDLEGLKLELRPDADLSGRIVFANPGGGSSIPNFFGTVVTVSPESRATVDVGVYDGLFAASPKGPAAPPVQSTPGPDGTFTLKGLRAWTYFADASVRLLRDNPESWRSAYLKSIHLGMTDVLSSGQPFDPAAGGNLNVVIGTDGGTLTGRVFGGDRNAMPYTVVVLVPDEPHRSRRDLYRTTRTDFSGRFSVQAIAPGSYKIFAWRVVDSGAWFFPEFLRPHEGRAVPVTIGPSETTAVDARLLP